MSEDQEQTEAREQEAGRRVAAFLADEHVNAAIERVKARYHTEWKAGASPVEREAAWAKTVAFDDLSTELQAVVESGKRAAIMQARRPQTKPTR